MKADRTKLNNIYSYYSEDEGFEVTLTEYKIKKIKEHCTGKSLLDVGCGIGSLVKSFSESFEKIVGIDGSSKKIITANKKNSGENIVYHNVMFNSYEPECKFDTIVCTNVLEHVEKPISFLKLLSSWLQDSGRLILAVPNAEAFNKKLGLQMGFVSDLYELTADDLKKGHLRIYNTETLSNDIIGAGFKLHKMDGLFFKPLPNKDMEQVEKTVLESLFNIGKDNSYYCSSLLAIADKI